MREFNLMETDAIAEEAQARINAEFRAAGFRESPPKITPGMVRIILSAAHAMDRPTPSAATAAEERG